MNISLLRVLHVVFKGDTLVAEQRIFEKSGVFLLGDAECTYRKVKPIREGTR
jgi:hypothetical protein